MERANDISVLIALLPKYRLLNSLYQQTAEDLKLSYDNQCSITDFYKEFNDKQAFEKAVMNILLSTNKEKSTPIIANLRIEIVKNIDTYIANKDFFDGIDTLHVCTERYNPLDIEIRGQLKDTNKLWKELAQVRNSLESANWKDDKIAIQRLTQEEERIESRYKKEQEILNILYERQKESDNHAMRYVKNEFANIHELGSVFLSLLDNYFPVEKEKTPKEIKPAIIPGLYFDMKLVSVIHHECNNIQFENLSETDFYALLNLQPCNSQLTVKDREGIRMCYLIYKLYEYLKTESRAQWRSTILTSTGIKEDYYNSKYKVPVSEIPSRENERFACRIDEIFKNLS